VLFFVDTEIFRAVFHHCLYHRDNAEGKNRHLKSPVQQQQRQQQQTTTTTTTTATTTTTTNNNNNNNNKQQTTNNSSYNFSSYEYSICQTTLKRNAQTNMLAFSYIALSKV